MYYLCEKYYKPITVQYYRANCVCWVPRLTSLDLRTIWTYHCTLRIEFILTQRSYCIGLAEKGKGEKGVLKHSVLCLFNEHF